MELTGYLRFVLALIFVLALVGVLAVLARRLGMGYASAGKTSRNRRLGIVEILPMDGKRRLVLISRDGVEHLLLLGAASETVVERDIAPPPDFADVLADAGAQGDSASPGEGSP